MTVIDEQDEYSSSPYSINNVWEDIKEYFNIERRVELLDHFYGKFEKNKIAGTPPHYTNLAWSRLYVFIQIKYFFLNRAL